MWACMYEGLEYDQVDVMPGKDTRKPDYMKLSGGIGTVPMIDDDGFILCESHAILVRDIIRLLGTTRF
eukprot:SAG31_NODE_10458_length_1136_cov_1.300868_1_plen_68_part_00